MNDQNYDSVLRGMHKAPAEDRVKDQTPKGEKPRSSDQSRLPGTDRASSPSRPGHVNPIDKATTRRRPKDDNPEESDEDKSNDMPNYEYKSSHWNPNAIFPRGERGRSMTSTLQVLTKFLIRALLTETNRSEKSKKVPSYGHAERHKQDTVPGNQSAMYAATQNAIREEFISKTPASEFSDWCRFTDKYPWLLDDSNDGVLYVNAAIKAQEEGLQVRAKLCIEKAVFLSTVGGKDQRDRDHFFERFHRKDPKTMRTFTNTYEAIEKLCRERLLSSAPSVPKQARPLSDDPRMRHITQSTSKLNINSSADNTKRRHTEAAQHLNEHYGIRSDRLGANRRPDVISSRGPPIGTQDPAKTNLQPSIKGSSSESPEFEKLDPNYIRRDPRRAGRFFKVGRIFSILGHEERSDENTSDARWRTRKGDVVILSHIRQFAVVREGHGYCWAVPINTYNGLGLKKSGFRPSDVQAHAIIYDSEHLPEALHNEPRLSKRPIEVKRSEDAEPLNEASRIDFAKVTTVEHNVRAMAVGTVSPRSMPNFENYWRQHLLEPPRD